MKVLVLVEGKEGEQERNLPVADEVAGEGILKVGRVQMSGAGGDRQRCISSCKPKWWIELLKRGERAGIRTPCRLAKMMVRPSHKPGKARSLSHLFLESAKFSAIGGRRPARAITVPPARPHVARAVPTLVIVEAAKRSKLSWSIERTLSSTSVKTDGSGCGDNAPLDAEKP